MADEAVVVNEPYPAPYRVRKSDILYEKIGPEYVAISFRAAKAAAPSVTRILNDTANHALRGMLTQLDRDLAQQLAAESLIDGMGVQMHLDGANTPKPADVAATLQSYGVPVFVTELDVDMQNVTGSDDERRARQAQVYADMMGAALQSGVCRSISVWGITDRLSFPVRTLGDTNAAPTMFGDDLSPKPAYYSVRDALQNYQQGQ